MLNCFSSFTAFSFDGLIRYYSVYLEEVSEVQQDRKKLFLTEHTDETNDLCRANNVCPSNISEESRPQQVSV